VRIEYAERARRDFGKLDPAMRKRVAAAVERLPLGDTRRLSATKPPTWRLRIGDWRVLYVKPEPDVILVVRVQHRSRAY
jgi:mRNA-degrading endonuclease RelE of RelBE toxin-antitoxin system